MGSCATKNSPLRLCHQDLSVMPFCKVGCSRAGTVIDRSVRQGGETGKEHREGQKRWSLKTCDRAVAMLICHCLDKTVILLRFTNSPSYHLKERKNLYSGWKKAFRLWPQEKCKSALDVCQRPILPHPPALSNTPRSVKGRIFGVSEPAFADSSPLLV